MPYKSENIRRLHSRDYQRTKAKKRKADKEKAEKEALNSIGEAVGADIAIQIRSIAQWCSSLRCPPGHPREGKPMDLPDYLIRFFEGALRNKESLLCISRKNSKSTGLALLCLCFLCGPLRTRGFRSAVVSLNLEKSREFLRLADRLSSCNNLPLKTFRSVPGRLRNEIIDAELECLSSDKNAGAAGGYDHCYLDELGLFDERSRSLVRSMYSSVVARSGRVISLSIRGDNQSLEEIIQRKDQPDTYVQIHSADERASILDEDAIRKANPGIDAGILKLEDILFHARSASVTPSDQVYFRSHHLNLKQKPDHEVLCSVSDWVSCEVDHLPELQHPVFIGVDLGGVSSMSCVSVYEPFTSSLRVWGAFPSVPSIEDRQQADGCGDLYERMIQEGSLILCGNSRVVDYSQFIEWVFTTHVPSVDIKAVVFDRYRLNELNDALDRIGVHCHRIARGTGASAKADGSFDVRSFQSKIFKKELRVERLKMWHNSLRWALLRTDSMGNPSIDKSARKGRIDAVAAAVLAVGCASANESSVPVRTPRFALVQ